MFRSASINSAMSRDENDAAPVEHAHFIGLNMEVITRHLLGLKEAILKLNLM